VRLGICQECLKDRGWCVYCQRSFKGLHRHIQRVHAHTIRALTCDPMGRANT